MLIYPEQLDPQRVQISEFIENGNDRIPPLRRKDVNITIHSLSRCFETASVSANGYLLKKHHRSSSNIQVWTVGSKTQSIQVSELEQPATMVAANFDSG